eukprot:6596350-Prymnesium_polylepis.1
MAQRYSANGTDVLLLKVAWGGTSLAKDWRPPSSVKAYGGVVGWCYTNFTAHAHAALAALTAQGIAYELVGMVWHQGWNDGCSVSMVAEYERNLGSERRTAARQARRGDGAPLRHPCLGTRALFPRSGLRVAPQI